MKQISYLLFIVCFLVLTGCNEGNLAEESEQIDYETQISEIRSEYDDEIVELKSQIYKLTQEGQSVEDELSLLCEVENNQSEKLAELEDYISQLEKDKEYSDQVIENLSRELDQHKKIIDEKVYHKYSGNVISDSTETDYSTFFLLYGSNWSKYEEQNHVSEAFFLGGAHDGLWYDVSDFYIEDHHEQAVVIDLFDSNDVYQLHTFKGEIGSIEIEYPLYEIYHNHGVDNHTFIYPVAEKYDDNFIVGVNCNWNPQPRLPEVSEDNSNFLIDVDGDGDLEKFYKTEEYYSSDVLWFLDWYDKEPIYDFHDQLWSSMVFVDLNGDDVLEKITVSSGYFSNTWSIYEYIDGEFVRVLHFESGD